MASQPSTVKTDFIKFGVFCVDLRKGELRKFDTPVKVQPQPFRLLLLLLNRSGELVTREEIRQEIWGRETYVDFARAAITMAGWCSYRAIQSLTALRQTTVSGIS